MENTYIPYSKRYAIADEKLGGLLDYLERVMAWDIRLSCTPGQTCWYISSKRDHIYTKKGGCHEIQICQDPEEGGVDYFYENGTTGYEGQPFERMDIKIFFNSYRTLLPEIRDLYRNK